MKIPPNQSNSNPVSQPEIDRLAEHNRITLELIGEDPSREGLLKTPMRVAKSLSYLTSGYQEDPQELMQSALFKHEQPESPSSPMMVLVKDIEFFSMCEHHMLPFFGRAHIAYFPHESIVGLSKLPRLVEIFARRLQVQERLTQQIMTTVNQSLMPYGVAVAIEASHLCMMMRGVQSQGAKTLTISTCGFFDQPHHRAEFLERLR